MNTVYRVLIVDDDRLMRNVIRKVVIENEKYEVIAEATNGEEALILCEKYTLDLIFLDIVMPQMNGLDAAKVIRQKYPSVTICFIFSYPNPEYVTEILHLNVNHYLKKPLLKNDLVEFLKEYHDMNIKKSGYHKKYQIELQDKSFAKAIKEIYKMVEQMCLSDEFSQESLYEQLIYMAKVICNQILYGINNIDILKKYPLQLEWVKEEELVKLWIFQIINYVWQEKSIRRYDILEIVFAYIEKNIKKNFSLSDIVRDCLVSQGYLSRIFKEQFSMSVMNYLKLRKIHMMKINLLFTTKSIAEIAEHIGYSDEKYMAKVFKKEEGISLNEYRNILKKQTV